MDSTDRPALEDQLAQAQKMEAVGQLTGGVAHDFNNLLTVVLGNIEIMGRRAEDEARRAQRIDAIRLAAERGRDLTKQLLAFSRRQNLTPVTADVGDLIRRFAPLLRQAVGEAVVVELDLQEAPLWAHVDVSQLEAALLNLAVNARDAMPDGGTLTVSAAATAGDNSGDLPAGSVRIAVRDTGVGMPAAVRDRVFEPFFTTKEIGRGSGLGLSQVYGFVRQSEGQVRIESEPGKGACVELYLPATAAPARPTIIAEAPEAMVGGSEKILVVEDDPSVLRFGVELLEGLGYAVVSATAAEEALAILRRDPGIELLFSDVVMPGGVNGIALSEMARREIPGLKVLLTSGFVGHRVFRERAAHAILDKPYEPRVLAARIRALLDEPAKRPPARRRKQVAAS